MPRRPADRAAPLRLVRDDEPAPAAGRVYQLKLTLEGIRPAIWRRVLVPEDATLIGLHRAIQAAMFWEDYHLWHFTAGGVEYGEPMDGDWGEPRRSARGTRLNRVAAAGDVLGYEYDYGDSWEVRVRVEKVLPAQPGQAYPVCVAGARAAPPEDCGGVWGYAELLEILADPAHPEYEERLDWLGRELDPEVMELEEINRRMASTRVRESTGGWHEALFDDDDTDDDPGEEWGDGAAEDGAEPPFADDAAESVLGAMRQLLQRALEQNPDTGLDELNELIGAVAAEVNARPLAEQGGLSPLQTHRLITSEWSAPDSAVRLNEDLSLAELEGSRFLHNARLFLARLQEAGEVKATPKGNLPRAFVGVLREAVRWPADAHTELFAERRVVNEEDVRPVHLTRILLELGGLIKRRKGVYSLTRAGERMLEERRAGQLFATLFRTHFQHFNLEYLDRVGEVPGFQPTIAYALYRFGQVAAEWKPVPELRAELLLPTVRLPRRNEHFDSMEIAVEARLLRPLEGFGLAEAQQLPREPGSYLDRWAYRKTPLYDRFLSFELGAANADLALGILGPIR